MRVFRGFSNLSDETALAIGNFDGLHLAHQQLLKALKAKAKVLHLKSCVVSFRPHPKAFFAPKQTPAPLMRLSEKLLFFRQIGIDNVVICPFNHAFAAQSAEEFIQILRQQLKTKVIFIGDDFHFGRDRQGNVQTFKKSGLSVEKIEELTLSGQRVSSSAIRAFLKKGEVEKAALFLGRDFSLSGRVQEGQKLGRTLGFATANILLSLPVLPIQGVFAVSVQIENHSTLFKGVANVGTRPTVSGKKALLEVHLFDFDANIYQKRLRVYFQHFLRSEKRFEHLTDLQRQIAQDALAARHFFLK